MTVYYLGKKSEGYFSETFTICIYMWPSSHKVWEEFEASSFVRGQFHKYLQKNMHQVDVKYFDDRKYCSKEHSHIDEFWEWEMGDWRKSRSMQLLATDAGHVSFVDLSLIAGTVDTVILPTFPIDSRAMQQLSSHLSYPCHSVDISSYDSIRALVFSWHEISSVVAKIYDSRSGKLVLVFEGTMQKYRGSKLRGDLYSVPWIGKAFVDQSSVRFWLQVEAIGLGRFFWSLVLQFYSSIGRVEELL